MSKAVSILMCHGGGFCKNVWEPITQRMSNTPLLQRVPTEMLTFDFPYHGTRRDVSERATLHLENPESPRVTHPARYWTTWTAEEVQRQVRVIREKQGQKRTPLIGIGHSMGAGALWITETKYPGTFDGLVLFEPIANIDQHPGADKSIDFLTSITLKRRSGWDTFEEAEAEFMSAKNFARWDRDALKAYVRGAVIKNNDDPLTGPDPDKKWVLSCHPHIEASLYGGPQLSLTLEDMARVQCRVSFQYGGRSQLFYPEYLEPVVKALPHRYRLAEAVPDATHALVMEKPDIIVDRIMEALEELPAFHQSKL